LLGYVYQGGYVGQYMSFGVENLHTILKKKPLGMCQNLEE